MLKTTDVDNRRLDMEHTVTSLPTNGVIEFQQTRGDDGSWVELEEGDTFTQTNLNRDQIAITMMAARVSPTGSGSPSRRSHHAGGSFLRYHRDAG